MEEKINMTQFRKDFHKYVNKIKNTNDTVLVTKYAKNRMVMISTKHYRKLYNWIEKDKKLNK